jgi:membrane-bound inhibitor of C-type lysozyme
MLFCHAATIAVAVLPGPGAARPSPAAISYACADGRTVIAHYPDQTTAVLEIEGRKFSLSIARSADGARYVGHGWQWWSKGMRDATLAPLAPLAPGVDIATSPGTACHAAS